MHQKIFWRNDESGFERRLGVLQDFVLAEVEVINEVAWNANH